MNLLKFKIDNTQLYRLDMNRLTAYTRNNAYAEFVFSEQWQHLSPLVAQFARNEECVYDVFIDNGKCAIPWEVLEGSGVVSVSVMGGDLITTNKLSVNVYDTGIVGGLVPTVASPSVYSAVNELAQEIDTEYKGMKSSLEGYEQNITEGEAKINEAVTAAQENIKAVADNYEQSIAESEAKINEYKQAASESAASAEASANEALAAAQQAENTVESVAGSISTLEDFQKRQLDIMFVSTPKESVSSFMLDEIAYMNGGKEAEFEFSDSVRGVFCGNGSLYVYGSGILPYTADDDYHTNYMSRTNGVYIADGVTNVGSKFFMNSNIKQVAASNSLKELNEYAFAYCRELKRTDVAGLETLHRWVFMIAKTMTEINLPNIVTISDAAFNNCLALESVKLGNELTSIGLEAFKGCSALADISIPSSVTNIGGNAFGGCTNLKTITINKAADSISGAPWGATNATVVWNG